MNSLSFLRKILKKIILVSFIGVLGCFLLPKTAFATAITSAGSGVWSAGGTWTGGVVPVEGDTVQIQSGHTITLDQSVTVGADTTTPAIDILSGGTMNWDNLGNDTLTLKGDFYVRSGGTLTLNGTADGTKTLTVKLNYSDSLVAGKYGFINEDGSTVSLQGASKTRGWDTLSTDALAGSAAVVTTNDNSSNWLVGDTVLVASMTKSGTSGAESRTIASFTGTTINLSGGNFSYKHDAAAVIANMTRSIVFTAYNTSYPAYVLNYNQTAANFDIDWVLFNFMGNNLSTKYGVQWASSSVRGTLDHCVINGGFYGLYYVVVGTGQTLTDIILANMSYGSYILNLGLTRDTISGLVVIKNTVGGRRVGGTIFENSHICNNSTYGLGWYDAYSKFSGRVYGNTAGLYLVGVGGSITDLTGTYFDGNTTAISATVTAVDYSATSLFFGVSVANTTDIAVGSGALYKLIATGVNQLPIVSINASSFPGTQIQIETSAFTHKTWKTYGTYEKQSTIKYSGDNALLMSPTSASNPLIAESTIFAKTGETISYSCYMRKSAAMATLPFVRLSGAGVTTSTSTMTDSIDTWELLTVSGVPTENGFAKIEFVAQNASGSVYVDDDVDSFKYWYEGDLPSVLPYPLTASGYINWPGAGATARVMGTEYSSSDSTAAIYAQILNQDGTPATSATVTLTVYDRNGSTVTGFDAVSMTHIASGVYRYAMTTPASEGTYSVSVISTSPTAYGVGEFHVAPWANKISTASEIATAVWNSLTSGLTTSGSIGKLLVDNIDTVLSGLPSSVWTATTRTLTSYGSLTTDVWSSLTSGMTTVGSIGKLLATNIDAAISTSGTSTSSIWNYLTSSITTSGSIGKLLVDNINATISSRSSHSASDIWSVNSRTLTSSLATQEMIEDLDDKIASLTGLTAENYQLLDKVYHQPKIDFWIEEGSVIFKASITNSSLVSSQTVPFKYYLPKELKKDDIIKVDDGLKLDYDTSEEAFYVSGEFELPAGEVKVLAVETNDIWQIPEEQISSLRKETEALLAPLKNTSYFAQGALIKSDIDVALDKVSLLQKGAKTPQERILAYREAKAELNTVSGKLDIMKTVLASAGFGKTMFGFIGGVQTVATWGMILVLAAGFIFLAIYLRPLTLQARLGRNKTRLISINLGNKIFADFSHLFAKIINKKAVRFGLLIFVTAFLTLLIGLSLIKKLGSSSALKENKQILGTETKDH